MPPRIWVALPDSLLEEVKHARERTAKLGLIARTCSIFKVDRIYLYTDPHGGFEGDYKFMKKVLEYASTPPYLKSFIPLDTNLRYAGLLPPLQIPSHLKSPDLKIGEVREGLVIRKGSTLMAHVGGTKPVVLRGRAKEGSRIPVRIVGLEGPEGRPLQRDEVSEYWGYEVKRAAPLARFLKGMDGITTILTSRKGELVDRIWGELVELVSKAKTLLVVFGGPKRGVLELLGEEPRFPLVNLFPDQGTLTVRTEEALLGALSLLHLAIRLGGPKL